VKTRTPWFLALGLVVASGPVFAQGGAGSTGIIQGQVVDESGAVVPGVTVNATSPVLLVAQTSTTNAQGLYRFPGLPAGTYKLTFEAPGFRTIHRDGIRIGIGFTATVNPTLTVKQVQEEMTVVGESPTIDTTATRVQTNFDKNQLDSLPNARDMWSLLAETPAVSLNRFDVGGSTAGTQTTYIAYGNGGQNRPLIEGINTTEGTSAAGFYFDYGSFDEVIIGAAANSAEMPSGGVLTNFIGKSGGNQFRGEVYYEYENKDVQSKNISDDQLGRGFANIPKNVIQQLGLKRDEANTLLDYKNLNASVGGPIVKDKVWLWAGYLRQQNVTYQPASGAILDGTEFLTKLVNWTGKMSYQMTPRDKFIAYLQYGTKFQPFRTDAIVGGPQHLTKDSTLNQESPSWVGKVEYNRTFGNRGFLEVRAGEFGYNFALVGNSQDPRREDQTTLQVTGGGRDWQLDRRRKQVHGAFTFFVDNKLGGNHQFKVGGEVQHETGRTRWKSYYADNIVQLFNNNAALAVRLGLPVDSWNGLRNYGLFLNDTYTFRRLTLNLGARYDRYRVFLPEQDREASRFSPTARHFDALSNVKTFNHVAPRIGAIYDLTGDGKTVLKANFGRYYFNPGVNLADALNPNTSDQYTEYAWTDRNGDSLWQAGEEGAIRTQVGGIANVELDANLRNSYTNEFSAWAERELGGQVAVRAGFVWKMDRDGYFRFNNFQRTPSSYNVPITIVDPGADGTRGTGDDHNVSMLNLNPAVLSLTTVNRILNPEGFEANYKNIEVGVNKRFSNKWSMVGSFLYTWTDEFAAQYFGGGLFANGATQTIPSLFSGFGSPGFALSPNDDMHQEFTTWGFKVHGTWEPAWGLRVTPIYRIQQGYPYGRVFPASATSGAPGSAGVNYGTQNLLVEPLDSHRHDTVKQLDVRLEKKFKVTGRARLGLIFDVYNVFNANPELNIRHTTARLTISETGANIPAFATPVTILPPRIARISARFDW
jgi:carboxypeptidase family protein